MPYTINYSDISKAYEVKSLEKLPIHIARLFVWWWYSSNNQRSRWIRVWVTEVPVRSERKSLWKYHNSRFKSDLEWLIWKVFFLCEERTRRIRTMLLSSTFFKEQQSVLHMDKGIAKQLCIYNNQHQSTIYSTSLRSLRFNMWIWSILNQWKYSKSFTYSNSIEVQYMSSGKVYHMLASSQLAVNPNHLQQSPAKKLKSCILPQTCHDTMCFADRQDQPWMILWAVYLWSLRMFDGNDICSLRPFWWFDYWSMFSWCVSSGHVVLMDGWMLRQRISKTTW